MPNRCSLASWRFPHTIKELTKTHGIYILILFVVILFNLNNFISLNELPTIDHSTTYLARNYILKTSFSEYQDLMPLWNPYLMGGTPYFDYVNSLTITSITGWIVWLFNNMVLATNLNYILDILLAALVMYTTVYYLTKNAGAGLIAGMVYGLAGPMIRLFHHGALTQMNGIIITPLIYLFLVRAFRQDRIKNLATNAIIVGLLFALQTAFNPDLKIVLFVALMFALYLLFQLITTRQIIRVLVVGLIVGAVFFGLTAQRLLPGNEFLELTSRGALPYEQSASRKTEIKDLFKTAIEPFYPQAFDIRPGTRDIQRSSKLEGVLKIGIVAFFLIISTWLFRFRTKQVIFLTLTALFALSITTGTWVFYFLWKYVPPFDSFRYLERVYSLFLFAAAGLAGFGTEAILEKIKWKKAIWIIAALVFLNLAIFNMEPTATYAMADVNKLIENNEILKYIGQDNDTFRMHILETTGIDWTTEYLQIPYGLEELYGEEGTWLVEYMNTYLGIGMQSPAKFWGMLNVKYITSTKPVEISGLSLIKEFENCTVCPPIEQHYRAFGLYLYLNKLMMPRAYIVEDAILIIGEKDRQMQAMYSLLLDKNFDPAKTALIYGKERVSGYSLEELKRYTGVVFAGQVYQEDLMLLKSYADKGGKLLPDIFKETPQITQEEINALLTGRSTQIKADYSQLDFDHKEFETNNQKGWLVISEKFSSFPGWHTVGIDKEIHKANGIVSAVWLDGTEDKLLFEYKPKSYVIGTWLMIATVIAIASYFIVIAVQKRKKSNPAS